CHDVSDGGVVATLSEMMLGGEADGEIGANVTFDSSLPLWKALFSESGGFVFEVEEQNVSQVEKIFKGHGVSMVRLGTTGGTTLAINGKITLPIQKLKEAWTSGFRRALA
ncbi:MAG: AIR synthase-related protein, partial [Nanoarchaeota archaeon]|nr:AIR synthase-related protein [Nanoarchaeota archaeon]